MKPENIGLNKRVKNIQNWMVNDMSEKPFHEITVEKSYSIDKLACFDTWYLWDDDTCTVIKTGSLDTVTEELRRREG